MGTDHEYRWAVHESIILLIKRESSRQSSRPNHPNQSIGSICMVPDTLRNLNPGDYTPRITSIGPLHKGDQRLGGMEEIKVTYMYRLFCETEKSTGMDMRVTTRTCVDAVFNLIGPARGCYTPSFINYDDLKLAEMMVIDGCFILELLYRSKLGIGEGDPIFDNHLVKHDVIYDLLLLENQIPFFILETLFQLTVKHILDFNSLTYLSLTDLIFDFFKDMNIFDNSKPTLENGTAEHCHILGLLQNCYKPQRNGGALPNKRYSATEIAGAGVTFKPQRNGGYQLTLRFKRYPCFGKASLEIPVLCIKDSTLSFLRNLIAYEQCYPLSRQVVTSFAFLMDMLIDTKHDVSLLVRAKVLQHNLGTCEDVANLFNNICNGVDIRDFYYSGVWEKLDDYCNRFWPSILISLVRLLFSLRRIYISTTWKTLTVIGAFAIFVLTLIQTIYSVRNA